MKKTVLLLLFFLSISSLFANDYIYIGKKAKINVKLLKEEVHSAYMFTVSPFGILDKKRSAFINENHLKALPKTLLISLCVTLSILLLAFLHYKFGIIEKIINGSVLSIFIIWKLLTIGGFIAFILWIFGGLRN